MIKQVGSALFYSFTSIMIILSNKIVLTTYKFSSFQTLAIGQLVVTVIFIQSIKALKIVKVSDLNLKMANEKRLLIVFYFGNLLFGLGGTKSLSLPMFTVLRRFSILMILYGEIFILKIKKPLGIKVCVYLMVIGTIIAALNDLAFEINGYAYIMLNNIFTAANGIYTKMNLDKKMGEYDILLYTSAFSLFPMLFLSIYTGETEKLLEYDQWSDISFWFFFIVSCVMGLILNYSSMLCTKFNSPLTTSVIGCLKNILVTYVGMFIGGDYVFSKANFVGLTISSLSSILYTYFTFKESDSKRSKDLIIDFKSSFESNKYETIVNKDNCLMSGKINFGSKITDL